MCCSLGFVIAQIELILLCVFLLFDFKKVLYVFFLMFTNSYTNNYSGGFMVYHSDEQSGTVDFQFEATGEKKV